MTGAFRAGMIGLLIGVLAGVPAAAQRADTVRVGDDSVQAAPMVDSAAMVDTTQSTRSLIDSSAIEKKDSAADHPEPVVLRTIGDSVVSGWRDDRAYAYANDPAYWRPVVDRDQPRRPSGDWLLRLLASKGFEYFLLTLLASIVLYAIIRIIMDNRLQLFYRAPRRVAAAAKDEPEPLGDDLEGKLMHFMQVKDYRQAVRYLYLKTLRLLNDRGLIKYHQQTTNHAYWQQLSATPQAGSFRDLTTIYEKVWYGDFPLSDEPFTRVHQYFDAFHKTIRE